jgi:hypothetical protein
MRKVAWILKADGPRGKAGDVVGMGSLRDPFQIAVSSPAGEVDRLTVTAAMNNHLFAGSEIQLPGGQTATVAWQAEGYPNFLFVRGSKLPAQIEVRLAAPIVVDEPLTDAVCTVTDMPTQGADDADGFNVELSPDDGTKSCDFHEGSSRMKWRMSEGKMIENEDDRPIIKVTAAAGLSEVREKAGLGIVAIDVEVVDSSGKTRADYSDPDLMVQVRQDHWVSVPVANGRGAASLSKEQHGAFRVSSGEAYRVDQKLDIIIAE